MELQAVFKRAYWSLAAAGLAYLAFVLLMTFPHVQRLALYAHTANPALWQDVNDVEKFGFLKTQVQPFNLRTPDNETLYGWHLLPLHLCLENEELLAGPESVGPAADYARTAAFKLLSQNPRARVVVNFHGNAAHLASAQRPDIYRALLGLSTPENPVHVFAVDYRGFGISTGSPTEEGVITDGMTLLNFLTSPPLNIASSRIVVVGQSLGTAVTAAVVERWTSGAPCLPESSCGPFAGVVLVASFSNLPSLISSYSFKGLTPPMLSPVAHYPRAQKWILDKIVDRWDTTSRVARLTGSARDSDAQHDVQDQQQLHLTIIHATNDVDIPWHEGQKVWLAATGENTTDGPGKIILEKTDPSGFSEVKVWQTTIEGRPVKTVRWERVGYGGNISCLPSSDAMFSGALRLKHCIFDGRSSV